MTTATIEQPLDVARRALAGFAEGAAGGGFERFLALAGDDIEFWMPPAGRSMPIKGRQALADYLDIFRGMNPRLDYEAPFRSLSDGTTVLFEYLDSGTLLGRPYHNAIAVSMDIREGRVAAYREYWGEIDLALLQVMSGG